MLTNTSYFFVIPVPRLGFELEWPENGTGEIMELYEGGTKSVCVVLVEPQECSMNMEVNVRLSPDSSTGKYH